YQKAQDLDLVIAVHVGGDWRKYSRDPSVVMVNNLAPVPGALHALYSTKTSADFPRVKWAFVEAGASCLPFAIQESRRADEWGGFRVGRDRGVLAADILVESSLVVTCQFDDALPCLGRLFGTTTFGQGTDYSHMDLGSDPYGLHIIASRSDLDANEAGAIVDSNARRLWGIDPSFTPAPPAALRPDIVEASRAWTN